MVDIILALACDELDAEVNRKCSLEGDGMMDARIVLYKFMVSAIGLYVGLLRQHTNCLRV